jgi:hypothetical protein
MARLSVEHYRANANMTPEHTRKSNRFRDIFKSRSSMSPSQADATAKSPPEPATAPVPVSPLTPTIKPGFEKVGLLPSERSSLADASRELEHNGGTHVVEALRDQAKELQDASVSYNVNTSLGLANMNHANEASGNAPSEQREDRADELAQAFHDALSKHSIDQTVMLSEVATEDGSTMRGQESKDAPRSPSQSADLGQSKDVSKASALPAEDGQTHNALRYDITLTSVEGRSTAIPGGSESGTVIQDPIANMPTQGAYNV